MSHVRTGARRRRKTIWVWVGGLLLFALVCWSALFMGAAKLSVADVLGSLTHQTGLFVSDRYPEPSPLRQSILFELRIPRVLMGVFVGAGLAVAGAALQAITRNDLAEPYLLGVSAGASAGAVVTVVLMPGLVAFGITGGAAVGALVSFGLLLLLLRGSGFASTSVVLTGVLIGQFFEGASSLILMARGDADSVRGITFWLLGAMGAARSNMLWIVIPVVIIAILLIWTQSRDLDAMSFGDQTASSMGVHVNRTRGIVLVVVSLLTAATVSAVGAIGFIGLIVPHAVRMVMGPLHRGLVPLSALVGGIFLVATDAVARVVFAPQELPVGVITAMIGVPVFFVILRKRRQRA